jgi:hypothetical protein
MSIAGPRVNALFVKYDQTSELKAYYYGRPGLAGPILVSTDHHLVNDTCFSMPKLDAFILNAQNSVRTCKVILAKAGDAFLLYYHDPSLQHPDGPFEILVFRKGVTPGRLVNIWSTDGRQVNLCITWCGY